MYGLHSLDIVVIVAYYAVVIGIGWRAMKKVRSQEDYFLGGRSFGKFLQTFSMFGQATSAETGVTMSSTVGNKGLAGVFFSTLQGMLGLPIVWFVPLWMRRARLMTLADLFSTRLQSRKLAGLYAMAQVCLFILVGAMGLQAVSKTVMAMTGKPVEELSIEERAEYDQAMRLKLLESRPTELLSEKEGDELATLRRQDPRSHFSYFNKTVLIFGIALFVILYAAAGGLEAAVWTDAMQSLFILVLTVILLPFSITALNALSGNSGLIGPFKAVHDMLPASMLELFGSPRLAGFTWYYIVLLSLIGIAGSFAYANNMVVHGAARSESAARYGAMNGIVIKRIATVFWVVLAMFILALYGTEIKDPDLLWGMASNDLLPVGLSGLMLACLLAALMSTADTHMVVVSGLITINIYKPLFRDRSEKHYLTAGRIFGLIPICGGVFVALYGKQNLFDMIVYMLMINVTMGPSILMAFLWRRTNTIGVWCSMGISLLMVVIIPLLITLIPAISKNPSLHLEIKPDLIEREYKARQWDVNERQRQIENWEALQEAGKAVGRQPMPLVIGESFIETYQPRAKAVFWKQGIKLDEHGKPYGEGMFRPELYIIHKLGVNLSKFSVATVESIDIGFKLFFPFTAVLLFGLLGKRNDESALDQFYCRLLTPVQSDPKQDAQAVESSIANPREAAKRKLWPESDWYIRKWNREDWKGIVYALAVMAGIFALILFLTNLGKS